MSIQIIKRSFFGKDFRTREVQIMDGSIVTVAEYALWEAIETEAVDENSAEYVDSLFVYYASDEELALSDRKLTAIIYGKD